MQFLDIFEPNMIGSTTKIQRSSFCCFKPLKLVDFNYNSSCITQKLKTKTNKHQEIDLSFGVLKKFQKPTKKFQGQDQIVDNTC